MKSIRDIPVRHLLVFVRVDFNVPLDDDGNITEDGRIKAVLPTIEYLLEKEARVVLASHLGRPKGEVVESLRLLPVAKRLTELLGQEVHYVDDCIGKEVQTAKERLEPGEVLLLENLRFYKQEKENDLRFAEQLAEGVDVFIQDAFGALHREHASTHALPSLVFDKGIGFLVEEELGALGKIIESPDQPFVVVIGGIKLSDKVDVIRNLAPLADLVMVGGGVANTFVKALGNEIGNSIVESDSAAKGNADAATDYVKLAEEIWNRFATEKPTLEVNLPDGKSLSKIVVPLDFVAAASTEPGAETAVIEVGQAVPEGWLFLDIGPKTRELYGEILKKARTIFWNGPMGLFEMPAYAEGSRAVAIAIAESDGYAVLGGGDTEVVVDKFGLHGRFSHISTGGGASLTFLAQKELPGLTALQ